MDNSPLRKLPLELRLDIYERAFHAEEGVKVTLNKAVDEKKRPSQDEHNSKPHLLALRSTCKEIANETAAIVFKVNDSWNFVQPDDDSTAWGKRVQQWSQKAGDKCLERAKAVQFDIGRLDSRPSRCPRGDITKPFLCQVGSLYQNLPKQLRQCEQSFKLRIRWSSGVELVDGSRDRLDDITLVRPMLADDDLRTVSCEFEAIIQSHYAMGKYGDTWYLGNKKCKVLPFCDPPEYDMQLQRQIVHERKSLIELARRIGAAASLGLGKSMRERLEEYAVDVYWRDSFDMNCRRACEGSGISGIGKDSGILG